MWELEPGEELVYAILGESDEGVFVPEGEAKAALALRLALRDAQTWGELRAAVNEERFAEIIERCVLGFDEDENEEPIMPADDDEFYAELISGYEDGDWPDWPAAQMAEWMPSDLAEEYLAEIGTRLNGSYFAVAQDLVDELVAELEDLGHPCRRDDDLVAFISGYHVAAYSVPLDKRP